MTKEAIRPQIVNVIEKGYCVGCGGCASSLNSAFQMKFTANGSYLPVNDENVEITEGTFVCPFASVKNESEISKELYSDENDVRHNLYIGYYLRNYAGYVKKDTYRENGSSGGMGSWIACKLLELGYVDRIIHVTQTVKDKDNILFKYHVSNSISEIRNGAKSKYYPVEMSNVINYVRENPGNYAFIGVPCFIKTVRLLSDQDPIIQDRIKYTIGLVCGHLKTDRFVKSMVWQMGMDPTKITKFDFRVKIEGRNASDYGVEAEVEVLGDTVIKKAPIKELFTTNWGHGHFKLKACDYCDDVLAETADVTIGDAWLPEYNKDSMGTNIITVRNLKILEMIEAHKDELNLTEIDENRIFESQAGGFRHRREGLGYRLYLKDEVSEWRPIKRVEASNDISEKRKKIYETRVLLAEKSHQYYAEAEDVDDFDVYINQMKPIIRKYDKLFKKSIYSRILTKLKRILNSK